MGRILHKILRDPSFWFFVVAALLLGLTHGLARQRNIITVRQEEIANLEQSFTSQWERTPTAAEREALLADYVNQELLWREGVRLGLDRADPIVRRRIVQKMTFLLEAAANGGPPSDDVLKSYFHRHSERYQLPERVTFQHVFLLGESRRDSGSRNAEVSLAVTPKEVQRRLEAGESPEALSAPFLRGLRWKERTADDIKNTFGADFLAALRDLPTGKWSEPIPSLYGWHLVRIESWHPRELPAFEAVRARVEQDWLDEARSRAREQGLQKLRARYRIVVESMSVPAGHPQGG